MTAEDGPEAPADVASSSSLGSLCSDVGEELLEVVLAPRGFEIVVSAVMIADPLDVSGAGIASGDLVLAIGLGDDPEQFCALIEAGAAAGAPAIVYRSRGAPSGVILACAEAAGVALLGTDGDTPWGALHRLIETWLDAGRAGHLPRLSGAVSGDLAALADATAKMAGGPVTIEDQRSRVLAFSQGGQEIDAGRSATILQRQVPTDYVRRLRRLGAFTELHESDGVVVVRLPGTAPRLAIAIRAGAQVLGSIWLVGEPEQLASSAEETLREAAKIAALHIIRHRVFDDLEGRVRGGMLRMLLAGAGLPVPMLERLRFRPGDELVVVAVEGAAIDEAPPPRGRLLQLALEHLAAYGWQAVGTAMDGRVYLLIGLREGGSPDVLRQTLVDTVSRAQSVLATSVRAGIGEWVETGEELRGSRRTADQSLDLGRGDDAVVVFDDVYGRSLVAEVRELLAERRLSPELRSLVEHDAAHGTSYVLTLRVFLDVLGDAGVAASRLHVHVNTLRYRVRRLVEIGGIDLADAESRLALELQLRAGPTPNAAGLAPGDGAARAGDRFA